MKKFLTVLMMLVVVAIMISANAEGLRYAYNEDSGVWYTEDERSDGSGFEQFMGAAEDGSWVILAVYTDTMQPEDEDEVQVWFFHGNSNCYDINNYTIEYMTAIEANAFARGVNEFWNFEGNYVYEDGNEFYFHF